MNEDTLSAGVYMYLGSILIVKCATDFQKAKAFGPHAAPPFTSVYRGRGACYIPLIVVIFTS